MHNGSFALLTFNRYPKYCRSCFGPLKKIGKKIKKITNQGFLNGQRRSIQNEKRVFLRFQKTMHNESFALHTFIRRHHHYKSIKKRLFCASGKRCIMVVLLCLLSIGTPSTAEAVLDL